MNYLWVMIALAFSLDALAAPSLKMASPNIVVYKKQRRMEVYDGATLVKVYRVGLGLDPVSPKTRQGDRATPEGVYRTCGKIPHSAYYKALVLNYPSRADADRGLKAGMISKKQYTAIVAADAADKCPPFDTALGGQVEIHGMGSESDWTWGCVALDDPDIEELYSALPNGTQVMIKP